MKIILLLVLSSTAILSTGCKSGTSASGSRELAMASMEGMPADVQSAPVAVQQAYQFASANPELMQHIPCYCGCTDLGHTSNYACYISGADANGGITYDAHALGCSICVDITHDTMRLYKRGKSIPEIKSYIDQTYSQYGKSNLP